MIEGNTNHVRGMFICLAGVLLGFGVLMVHSASITSWPSEFERVYLSRHLVFLAFGVLVASLCAWVPGRIWYRIAPSLFILTAVLLVAVLIPGVGTKVNGAQRWLRFSGLSLQPSELAKIALPLFVARIIVDNRERSCKWYWGLLRVVAPIALTVVLVVLEPDLGTSLFLALSCGVLLFVGGWPIRYFVACLTLALPAVGSVFALKSYQAKRITGFLAAWNDFNEAPYQLKQALVTLGAGGVFGAGLGKGWQKLSFLPEANTDFVFAVVGEELGLIGTLSLVAVWAGLYVAGLSLLRQLERGSFAFIVSFTLLTQLVLQAALNMAVVTALVPPKGIPHPLISYGGSNLFVSIVSLGIVVGLSRDDRRQVRH